MEHSISKKHQIAYKCADGLTLTFKRKDPATTANELINLGSLLGISDKISGFLGYKEASPAEQAEYISFCRKSFNGIKMKSFLMSGTGARALMTSGSMLFVHVDNSIKIDKVNFSDFLNEYKELDTLLTVPVDYWFNQNNSMFIDISSLEKDETITLNLRLSDFNDVGAE